MANLKWFPYGTVCVPEHDLQHHLTHLIFTSWAAGRKDIQIKLFSLNQWGSAGSQAGGEQSNVFKSMRSNEINDLSNHSKHVPKSNNTIRNAKYSNYLVLWLCLIYNWRQCFYRLTVAPVSLNPDLLFTQSCNEFASFSSSISDPRSDMHLFNTSLKYFEPIAYKISEVIVQHRKSSSSALRFYLQIFKGCFLLHSIRSSTRKHLSTLHAINLRYRKLQFLNHSSVTLVTLFTKLKSYKLVLETNSLKESPVCDPSNHLLPQSLYYCSVSSIKSESYLEA